jgi:hypothetical protein
VPDDATTGSMQLRDTLERHLLTTDLPPAKRGPRGAIGRMLEKAERFAPGAGKKHREKADSEYAQAVTDGNTESGVDGGDQSSTSPAATGGAGTDTGSVGS